MSRTIIDLPHVLLSEADELCAQLGISRAELIRRALREFLQGQPPVTADGFGLWAGSSAATDRPANTLDPRAQAEP